MSDPKKPEEQDEAEAKPEEGDNLGEEQLESVAGGVLIGLNKGALAHKELLAYKIVPPLEEALPAPDLTIKQQDTAFKFFKK